jgi:predicted ATP-grasp superfamily ATP-dependent carboligase
MGDPGYRGNSTFVTKDSIPEELRRSYNGYRVRIERINSAIKKFATLGSRFRGTAEQHQKIFFVVCNIHNFKLLTKTF